MTGEITLRGRVLPVGGIREKVLAAHRAGLKTIILPERNVDDLDELPDDVRNELTFIPVQQIDEVLSNALVAYGLARIPWRGRSLLFGATIATMMIPGAVLMVPIYVLWRRLGLIGTFAPLWLPAFFGSAFNIFLLRQFFTTIPLAIASDAPPVLLPPGRAHTAANDLQRPVEPLAGGRDSESRMPGDDSPPGLLQRADTQVPTEPATGLLDVDTRSRRS